jgi:hypothetical protein
MFISQVDMSELLTERDPQKNHFRIQQEIDGFTTSPLNRGLQELCVIFVGQIDARRPNQILPGSIWQIAKDFTSSACRNSRNGSHPEPETA